MTIPEILVLLLEEAQKFQYGSIRLYRGQWTYLENFAPTIHSLSIVDFNKQNGNMTRGFIIMLEKVFLEKLLGSSEAPYEHRLTIGSLTTVYQPDMATLYICYEI